MQSAVGIVCLFIGFAEFQGHCTHEAYRGVQDVIVLLRFVSQFYNYVTNDLVEYSKILCEYGGTTMSAGKILLLVFGIIILLLSIGLIAGGGTLLWANSRYVDSEGYFTSDTLHVDRDSYAVVAGPIELDETAVRVLKSMGVITVFEFQGENNNPSKQIFMGVADEAQLENYLDNVEYDEINNIGFGWRLDFGRITYTNHPGDDEPSPPASESIWAVSAVGSESETLVWETGTGSHSIVMMNGDASRGVDLDIIFRAKIPSLRGFGVGLLVAGIVLLAVASLMIFLAVRRKPAKG